MWCGVAVAVADGHGRQCENIIMMTTTTKNEMCALGRKFSARAENNEMNIIIYVRFVRASVAMLNGTRKTSSKQWFFDNRKKNVCAVRLCAGNFRRHGRT